MQTRYLFHSVLSNSLSSAFPSLLSQHLLKMPPKYQFKANEIVKEGRVKEEDLTKLKLWNISQKLPKLTEEQLVLFLLSANNDVEYAQVIIHRYFYCRSQSPEFFYDMDMEGADMRHATTVYEVAVMPNRSPNNEVVIFGRLKNTSYRHFDLTELFKLAFITAEYFIRKVPSTGIVVNIDMSGVGVLHLTKVRLGAIQKFFSYIQEGIPCQIRQVHILNTVSFIDKILFILKPFMNNNLLEAIKFHSSKEDLDLVFKDIPTNCRPSDYGGNLPEMKILSEENLEEMGKLTNFYSDIEEQVRCYEKLQNN